MKKVNMDEEEETQEEDHLLFNRNAVSILVRQFIIVRGVSHALSLETLASFLTYAGSSPFPRPSRHPNCFKYPQGKQNGPHGKP